MRAIPALTPLSTVSFLYSLCASYSDLDAARLNTALGCAPSPPIKRSDIYSLLFPPTSRGTSGAVALRRGCLLLRLLDMHILYISPGRCLVLFPLHTPPGSASTHLRERLAHDTAHYEGCVTPTALQGIQPPPQQGSSDTQDRLLTTTLRTLLESVMDALKGLNLTAAQDVSNIHGMAQRHGGGGVRQADLFHLDGTAKASVSAALGAVEGVQASLAALDEVCGTGAIRGVGGHVRASSSFSLPPTSPSSSSTLPSRRALSLRQYGEGLLAQKKQQQHTSASLLVDEVDLGLARMHGELQVESQTLEDALVVIKTGLALKRNQLGKLRLVLLIAQSCILFATLNELFHINSGFVYTFPLVPLFSNGTATGTYQRSSFVLSLSSFYWVTGVSVRVE